MVIGEAVIDGRERGKEKGRGRKKKREWENELLCIYLMFYACIFCMNVLFCQNITREKHFHTKNARIKH